MSTSTDAESYRSKLRAEGDNPDLRSPGYLSRMVFSHCDEAARRFAGDPDRIPGRSRNFLIRVSHYWHGDVQELVQANASRERIQEVFAECKSFNGIELNVCEELIRFKLAGPEEREGLTKLIEFAREGGLTENYAIDLGVKLLERCRQGYDV